MADPDGAPSLEDVESTFEGESVVYRIPIHPDVWFSGLARPRMFLRLREDEQGEIVGVALGRFENKET